MKRAAVMVLATLAALGACSSQDAQFDSTAVEASKAVASKVNGDALRPTIESILSGRSAENPIVSKWSIREPIVHLNSQQLMVETFTAMGYSPVVEPFGTDDVAGTNVYVDVPGDTDELVLVAGHHDAWFQSGADDNASALAVIVEAARALANFHGHRSVRLIAFDREEEGLLGSTAYLAAHANESVRVLINMDCVGYASHEKGSQSAPPGFALRDTGDFIAILANGPAHLDAVRVVHLSSQLPATVDALGLLTPNDSVYPALGAFRRSDHALFWSRGIPALFVTDTADFRNKNYHTPDDTPDKLDYDFLGRVAQLVVASAVAFAESN